MRTHRFGRRIKLPSTMPGIIRSCPNVVYVILGATHPHLVQQQGETYRDGLTARVRELGIENHVVFFNQFVEQAMLLDFISMCDVYVTPYLNEAQMTSGTLAYSFGLGKAVVSTPYWHATELLSDGSGILVPFGDAAALSAEISGLLTNDVRRHAMNKFRKLGFIDYNGKLEVHNSLLNVVLYDKPEIKPAKSSNR